MQETGSEKLHGQEDDRLVREERYRHVITVAMLDIDNFKTINDIYGHQMGDEVLRLVGQLVLDTVRQIDIPGGLVEMKWSLLSLKQPRVRLWRQ